MHELIITHVIPAMRSKPVGAASIEIEPAHTEVYRFEFEDTDADQIVQAGIGWLRTQCVAGGMMENSFPGSDSEIHDTVVEIDGDRVTFLVNDDTDTELTPNQRELLLEAVIGEVEETNENPELKAAWAWLLESLQGDNE